MKVQGMNTKVLVEKIARFHESYEREFLQELIQNRDQFLKDPKDALFFIFHFSFYQGRRDELSERFERRTKEVLEQIGVEKLLLKSKRRMIERRKLEEEGEYKKIMDKLEKAKVKKKGDQLMVVSFINLIQSVEEKNILKFIISKIKIGATKEAHEILDGVWSVGEKIASLILRDVVYIYELEGYFKKPDDYYFLQPVDTWVHKLSRRIGLIERENIYVREARDIADRCIEFGINPIHYNQGAWYIGTNSLEVLLRNIEVIE